jgi:putative aldouronate transport system permease protein
MEAPGTTTRLKRPFYKQRGFRLFLLLSPCIVYTVIFSYLPLYGWVYAFFDYFPGLPIGAHNFVGFDNFRKILQDSVALDDIRRVMANTLGMNFIGYAFSWLPMAFAIFLNELKVLPFRKTVQTVTTIPNFISWVLVYSIAFAMFSVDDGLVNRVLLKLGVIDRGISFLGSGDHVWIGMWAWGTWKGLGWSAIVYIAAIMGIDQELYEAARVDGAGRFACMWHITLPGLIPTYIVLFIMSIASLVNGNFDGSFVFQNPMNRASIEVLDLYVYNQGIAGMNYAYSIAVGMLKSLISIALLMGANGLSKLFREEAVF